MKQLFKLSLVAAALLPAVAFAQGANMPAPTPAEEAAVNVVAKWANLLEQGKAEEAYATLVSPDFDEHDDNAGGKKVNKDDIGKLLAKDPLLTAKNPVHIAQVLKADGDLVFMSGRIGVDVFRVKDGLITDHWNFNVPDSKLTLKFPEAGQ